MHSHGMYLTTNFFLSYSIQYYTFCWFHWRSRAKIWCNFCFKDEFNVMIGICFSWDFVVDITQLTSLWASCDLHGGSDYCTVREVRELTLYGVWDRGILHNFTYSFCLYIVLNSIFFIILVHTHWILLISENLDS